MCAGVELYFKRKDLGLLRDKEVREVIARFGELEAKALLEQKAEVAQHSANIHAALAEHESFLLAEKQKLTPGSPLAATGNAGSRGSGGGSSGSGGSGGSGGAVTRSQYHKY